MLNNLFIFLVALALVIKGATVATKYAARLAESFNLSKYVIGLIVVAVISILPETFISINSAIQGVPEFGLGTLFGSNVADMTLVFFIIVLFAGRGVKIESRVLKDNRLFPLLLAVPIILGLNGHYSRLEGAALIVIGLVFYYMAFRNGQEPAVVRKKGVRWKNFLCLLGGMALLLIGSHFTVTSASSLAVVLGVSPVLIGMLIVGLGTTIPELSFSLKSVRRADDGLAVGDILGTVLADATVVVGVIALISPFAFPKRIIYLTGLFMVGSSIMLLQYLSTGRTLTRRESFNLLFYWLIFVLVEFAASQ